MKEFVEKVIEFNEVTTKTDSFDARRVALYIGLVLEEVEEIIAAIPNPEKLGDLRIALKYHSRLFKEGAFDAQVKDIDRAEALDGFVDTAVVALGGGHALNSDLVGACHHVADNNLSKSVEDEKGVRYMLKDENGKVKKPDGYVSANVAPYLK